MTVITEGDKIDTVFKVENLVDTFYITERAEGTIIYRHDTIEVNIECPPDTLYIPYEKEVTTATLEVQDMNWFERQLMNFGKIALIFGALGAVGIIVYILIKIK
jgi:hypothetical protein